MAVGLYELLNHKGDVSNPFSASSLSQYGGSIGSGQPSIIVIIASNSTPLGASEVAQIRLSPGPRNNGGPADSSGNISVTQTYTGFGAGWVGPPDGIHYTDSLSNNLTFAKGFWGQNIDIVLTSTTVSLVNAIVQVSTSDTVLPIDSTGPPSGIFPPSSLAVVWQSDSSLVTYPQLTWTDNSSNETGFAIERSDDRGSSWNQIAVVLPNTTSFSDYSISKGRPQYRVYSFNDTVRSAYSNTALLPFTIASISPNSSLIGAYPTVTITGTGLGTSLFTQVSAVRFRSRLNSSFVSSSPTISPIGSTSISVKVPSAPNGSEFVDVVIDNGAGNISTLLSGYNYTIQSQFQFTLQSNSLDLAGRVSIGNQITVASSGGANSLDFTKIQAITLSYTGRDGNTYTVSISPTTTTSTLLIFTLPDFSTSTPSVINILVTSTQFSGSITLAQLPTIYFTDASGIYVLSQAKTNDTLYTNTGSGNTTANVKIPDPMLKTGFLP